MSKKTILFVCTGNTCRSPMAEALFQHEWQRRSGASNLRVISAGLGAINGEELSEHTRRVISEAGIALEHCSILLDEDQAKKASLILVMSRQHYEWLRQRFPFAARKTFLLKEFAGFSGDLEISDPYGGPLEEYRRVFEEIRDAVTRVVSRLERGWPDENCIG